MPEQDSLFVVKRTILDPKDPKGLSFNIALPATFTDLQAAKVEAKALLSKEGYDTDFFTPYEVKSNPSEWKHGDGVIVFAKAPSGEVFKVEIDTVQNSSGLQSDASGKVQQPLSLEYEASQYDYWNAVQSSYSPSCVVYPTSAQDVSTALIKELL